MAVFGGVLGVLAVLLVLALLRHEGEPLWHFIHWAREAHYRPRIVADYVTGATDHIEPDLAVLPLPPFVDMPPGGGFLSNEVARRRYTEPLIAQQVSGMRARQIAAIASSSS